MGQAQIREVNSMYMNRFSKNILSFLILHTMFMAAPRLNMKSKLRKEN